MTLIELQGATIALAPIPSDDTRNRRERECNVVQELVDYAMQGHVEICHRSNGAPYIAAHGSPYISVSHSHHIAALLWTDTPGWGIDIEEARPEQLKRVASRVLTDDEIRVYSENLLMAWTLKEAAFKAADRPIADLREINLHAAGCISARDVELITMLTRSVTVEGVQAWLSVVRAI